MSRTPVRKSLVIALAIIACHVLGAFARAPWAHFVWRILLILDMALLAAKCVEVVIDIFWVMRSAARYVLRVERVLEAHAKIDMDVFDLHHRHQPASWAIGRKHSWALPLVHVVFRVPALIALCWFLLLRLTWARPSGMDEALLVLAAASILIGIFTSVLSAIIQRLYYGWFDFYKREWRIDPVARYTLRAHQIGSVQALRVQVAYLIGILYVTIAGFGAIYYVLFKLCPKLFHVSSQGYPLLQMVYFSAVTLATVGYGDIHPQEWLSEALVLLQITTGPLFLTLLILTLGGPTSPPTRQRRQHKWRRV